MDIRGFNNDSFINIPYFLAYRPHHFSYFSKRSDSNFCFCIIHFETVRDRIENRERESVAGWCDRNLEINPVDKDQVLYDGLKNLAKYLKAHWGEKVVVLSY